MSIKLITFGCRLNIYESEVIKTFLNDSKKFENEEIIIFNSCTVTSEAEKQLRQSIRKTRKENINAIIGVVGCAVQTNPDTYKEMKEIDFIFGNFDKMQKNNYESLISILEDIKINKSILISDLSKINQINLYPVNGFAEKIRGFVQIQNGCDNHCTFCATRLARGSSISIPSSLIINQINKLISNSCNEIVLTGIDITDYGKGINENINLGILMKKILKETNLKRLRLSSVDIADINDDLKDVFFNEDRVMPHIHISLQSGDDIILKRMARRHNRKEVINFCEEIRKYRKNIAIGADLIAGFPTENDEMHKNSCDLIKEIDLTFGHIFPYSVRKNTPASLMEQVSIDIRRKRAKELREISKLQLLNFTKEQLKIEHKVLIESEKIGRTENYLTVKLPDNILKDHKIGDIISWTNKI